MPNNYAEIGYQGENIWRPVTISIADLVARHPGGYAVLMITRPGEREAYIAENMEQTADSVIWTPTDYDTARPGVISAQAIYSVNGEQVGKTAVHKYTVNNSLSAGDGTPYSWEDWVNELIEAAAGVDESISEAEETLDTAVQNAQDAQTAAETAQEKAEEAQGKAEDAQEAAETAERNVNQTKAAIDQTKILIDQAKSAVDEAKEAVDDTADEVEQNAEDAEANALKAEGYAVGTQEGTPAVSGQPYFHDNAKYYKEQSESAKDGAVAAKNRAEQVVDGIEAAGTAQVQRVTQEGGTQVTAVQSKGQEVLGSIPEDYTELTEEVSQLSNALQDISSGVKRLVHDNLLEGSDLTADKILAWANGAVTDGGGNYTNYYCTVNAIPCSQHFLPVYVVDKDMTLKAKVFQFFTYSTTGMQTHANNADVPCNVDSTNIPYVASFRMTLDRTAFGEADESGTWAWAFTAQDYAKHVEAGSVYLYEDAPATSITQETVIEREVKSGIANAESLIDSGIIRYVSRNLLDKAAGENGYALDPLGYKYATTSTLYVVDVTRIKPDTLYTFTQGTWLINTAFWLDSNGTPISKLALDSTHYTFTSPSNAYGVRCAVTTNGSNPWANAKVAVYEGDTLLDYEEYYSGKVIRDDYLPGFKHWSQYKYYSIGDSRTAGAGCSDRSKVYPKVIQQMTGIVNVNAAVDGAAYCQRSGISIPTMYEQAASVPLDTDIVTIFGGTNDRIVGVVGSELNPVCTRGTMDYYVTDSEKYDVTTFRGAIRQTIKNIKLRCPAATIIFIVDDLNQSPDGDPQTNAKFVYSGSTAWCEAVDGGASEADMIREVAGTYGLPVIDASKIAMTGRAGDEYLDSEYRPFADNLHESDFGNEMLARAVAGEMAKYLW